MAFFRRKARDLMPIAGEEGQPPSQSPALSEEANEQRETIRNIIGQDERADLALAMAAYGSYRDAAQDDYLEEEVEDAPIIRLANTILQQAVKEKASLIVVEVVSGGVRVLYRLDEIMHETMTMPPYISEPIIGRYKVMADLSAGLKSVIQRGTIHIGYDGKLFNFRLTCIPTQTGEKLTFHLFDPESVIERGLGGLGFTDEVRAQLDDLTLRKSGLILFTGGQASGISTTMYTLLNKINFVTNNCYAIGKPDYSLGGIACIDPETLRRTTPADVLRTLAKQDADVILVDAPTDENTLKEAVRAAENGVLVLCGMYGQGAVNGLMRLTEIGIEPRRIGQSTLGVLAQTLVRKVCGSCKEFYEEDANRLKRFGLRLENPEQIVTLARGLGCEVCRNTGYKGRMGLFELFRMQNVGEMLPDRPREKVLLEEAKACGMHELREDGLLKVLAGQTTPDELWRTLRIV